MTGHREGRSAPRDHEPDHCPSAGVSSMPTHFLRGAPLARLLGSECAAPGAIGEKVLFSTAWSATAGRMSASDRAPARPTHNVMDARAAKRQAIACLRV